MSSGGLPFRVRPEARSIWRHHTAGTVGALLGQPPATATARPGQTDRLSPTLLGQQPATATARPEGTGWSVRRTRHSPRGSAGRPQPVKALPITGIITQEGTSEQLVTPSDVTSSSGRRSSAGCHHGYGIPSHGDGIPSPTNGIPSPRNGTPSLRNGIPAPVNDSPGSRIPSLGNGMPSPSSEIPSLGNGISSPGNGVPSLGNRIPAIPLSSNRIPSPGDGILSLGNGFPSPSNGLPSPSARLPSPDKGTPSSRSSGSSSCGRADDGQLSESGHCADPAARCRAASVSGGAADSQGTAVEAERGRPARTTSDSQGTATEAERGGRLPARTTSDLTLPSCLANNKTRSGAANGGRLPSAHWPGEGIPSPGEGIPSRNAAVEGIGSRYVHLAASGDEAGGGDRRRRIRDLLDSLRRPPADGSGDRAPSVTSDMAVTSRFSDKTRQSFRELALERARAPYRAPSLAGSRKFKSAETLREGAGGRPRQPRPGHVTRLPDQRGGHVTSDRAARWRPQLKPSVDFVRVNRERAASEPRRRGTTSQTTSSGLTERTGRGGAVQGGSMADTCRTDRSRRDGRRNTENNTTNRTENINTNRTENNITNRTENINTNRTESDRVPGPRQLQGAAVSGPAVCTTEKRHLPPGELPRYLVRRRQRWQEEEEQRRRLAPDPACPPGHVLMPEHERQETLAVLRQNEQSLLSELRSLPIAHSSSRLLAQRSDIEQQLKKIEHGIAVFSRPKVFVRTDC